MPKLRATLHATLIVMSHCAPWYGKCDFMIPNHQWCGADDLLDISNIWVFRSSKNKSSTTKHAYNEIFIESYDVHFNIDEPLNLTWMMPPIGMYAMVAHAPLCNILDFSTLGAGCSINPAWIENQYHFRPKIHTIMLQSVIKGLQPMYIIGLILGGWFDIISFL